MRARGRSLRGCTWVSASDVSARGCECIWSIRASLHWCAVPWCMCKCIWCAHAWLHWGVHEFTSRSLCVWTTHAWVHRGCKCICAFMHRCVGASGQGRTGVCVHLMHRVSALGVLVHGCTGALVQGWAQVYGCGGTQGCQCVGTSIHRGLGAQLHLGTAHRYPWVWLHQCTHTSLCKST